MNGLRPDDLERFAALGIDAPLLELAKVHRVTHAEARDQGIQFKSPHLEGIVYPYLDPKTGHVVTLRIRRDHPEVEPDGGLIAKYVSPSMDHHHVYFPPGSAPLLADTSVTLVFVESEKSALAITAAAQRCGRRVLAIATGGCWGWRGRIGKTVDASGARVNEKGPLSDLARVTWPTRDTIILFDSNAATNGKVQAARRAFAKELLGRDASVRIAALPVEDGINGPDDFVGRYGDARLFALLDAARVERTPDPQDNADERGVPKESQATTIVRLVTEDGADLWHTPDGDAYLTIRVHGHREHHPLLSRGSRDYLTHLFYLAAASPDSTVTNTGCTCVWPLARPTPSISTSATRPGAAWRSRAPVGELLTTMRRSDSADRAACSSCQCRHRADRCTSCARS